jgi:hypothetical protein
MQMDYVPRLRHRRVEEGARVRVGTLAALFVMMCLLGLGLSYKPVGYSLLLLVAVTAVVFNLERHRRRNRV